MKRMWLDVLAAGAGMLFMLPAAAHGSLVGAFSADALGSVAEAKDGLVFFGGVTAQTPKMGFELVVSQFAFTSGEFPLTFEGTLALSSPAGGLLGSMQGSFSEQQGDTLIGLGQFSILSGDGAFTGVTGFGDLAFQINVVTQEAHMTIQGMLVPGPAALAGVAGFGLLGARRRRACSPC